MVCFYIPYVGLLQRASFKISEQSLENLNSEGVPKDILEKLKGIQDREVRGKEKFLTILENTIGAERTVQYQSSLLRHASDHNKLHVPRHEKSQRAFRIRLFEPISRKDLQDTRPIIPWSDAAALSIRAFTKIGLGASYPNTRELKVLTSIEWILGVYMLIHFSIAVKNNLPFIAPFLGAVN